MEIYINEEQVRAELTGEKNLEEVYNSFQDWVVQQKRYILDMQIDRQEIAHVNLAKIAADTIDRIDFYVGDELDMLLRSISELDSYIDQIGSTLFELEQVDTKSQKDLKEGLKWILQILESFSSITNTKLETLSVLVPGNNKPESVYRILERLERRIDYFSNGHNKDDIEDFLVDLRTFKYFIMRLEMQLRSMGADTKELLAVLEEFEREIPKYKEGLTAINESFQKGKDVVALNKLEGITAKLNVCIAALYAVDYRTYNNGKSEITELSVESVSFHTVAGELTKLLEELSHSLEEGDIVAVGDILEYELTDSLDALQPYITRIHDFCKEHLDTAKQEQEKEKTLVNC